MTLFIFPGQPLQCEQFSFDDDDFCAVAQMCRQRCGYDLANHQALPGYELSHHTCLQVYGVAMSLYRLRQLRGKGIVPDLVAEHSLGINAALVACGSIDEGDVLEMTCRMGGCMSRMKLKRDYSLGCAIGIAGTLVEKAAQSTNVSVANYNTSHHFLLAGYTENIKAALDLCQVAGAFSVSCFSCEAPLHTPLMSEIDHELSAIIADYHFDEPLIPLLEHISQTRLKAGAIPGFLLQELHQPVYWERSWKRLQTAGFNRCIEVGSGKSLTKFNRWIDAEAAA